MNGVDPRPKNNQWRSKILISTKIGMRIEKYTTNLLSNCFIFKFIRSRVIELFEVAILDGFLPPLVQPQTKKHWHFGVLSIEQSRKGRIQGERKGSVLFSLSFVFPFVPPFISLLKEKTKRCQCFEVVAASRVVKNHPRWQPRTTL